MPIHGRQPKAMTFDQVRACADAALSVAGARTGAVLEEARQAPPSLVSHWPAWVGKSGAMSCGDGCILWCEPQRDPQETFPSQLILSLSDRLYAIAVLDVMRGEWISSDTAKGKTLVLGLPYTAGTLLIHVRPAPVA